MDGKLRDIINAFPVSDSRKELVTGITWLSGWRDSFGESCAGFYPRHKDSKQIISFSDKKPFEPFIRDSWNFGALGPRNHSGSLRDKKQAWSWLPIHSKAAILAVPNYWATEAIKMRVWVESYNSCIMLINLNLNFLLKTRSA